MRNAILLPLLLVLTASAQNAMMGVGVGLEKTIVQVSGGGSAMDMSSVDILPVDFTTFSIPVLISGHASVEPEFGFVRSSTSHENSIGESESSFSILQLGLGMSGVKKVENLLYTFGIKAGISRVSSYSKSSGSEYKMRQLNFHFGPVLGVEYFFVPKLSMGAQVGVSYIKIGDREIDYDDIINEEDESSDQFMIGNNGRISLRWYY
jgi:hypothetical protein